MHLIPLIPRYRYGRNEVWPNPNLDSIRYTPRCVATFSAPQKDKRQWLNIRGDRTGLLWYRHRPRPDRRAEPPAVGHPHRYGVVPAEARGVPGEGVAARAGAGVGGLGQGGTDVGPGYGWGSLVPHW